MSLKNEVSANLLTKFHLYQEHQYVSWLMLIRDLGSNNKVETLGISKSLHLMN